MNMRKINQTLFQGSLLLLCLNASVLAREVIMFDHLPSAEEIGEMLILEKFSQEKLVVEGHTDASGSQQYNYYLSERRAHAMKKFLIKRYQISPKRLFIAAQGESSPLPGRNPFAGVTDGYSFIERLDVEALA